MSLFNLHITQVPGHAHILVCTCSYTINEIYHYCTDIKLINVMTI
jgi:hypothetical protein